MLRFEGDRDFPQTPEEVFAKLTDARFLASCVPDAEAVSAGDADGAAFKVRPSLAFMKGTLDVTLRVVERAPPGAARLVLTSKGVGSSSTVEATLGLAPQGGGTHLHWMAEVKELGGLLKLAPHGLIRGAAQKVLDDAWKSVEARMRET